MAEADLIILNNSGAGSSQTDDPKKLMSQLRTCILQLKSDFISEDGSTVNYKAMAGSDAYKNYKSLASGLRTMDLNPLLENELERKAFFINLYNVQMMDALVTQTSLPEAPTKVKGMWSRFAYNIGGHNLTLDEIEHGILRGNKAHPSNHQGPPIFGDPADPRIRLAVTNFDPRIHFALNCGALSCPPIRIYTAEKLDKQLQMAAGSFCNQEVVVKKVSENKKQVELSKLLLWYGCDFGASPNEILAKLCHYITDANLKAEVKSVIDQAEDANLAKILFKNYDWTLNNK